MILFIHPCLTNPERLFLALEIEWMDESLGWDFGFDLFLVHYKSSADDGVSAPKF